MEKSSWSGRKVALVSGSVSVVIVFAAVLDYFCVTNGHSFLRFDQYMESICTSTAALCSTLFGLSAASYAFVCSELRVEEKGRPHLDCILSEYRGKILELFLFSLIFTMLTVASTLIGLGSSQSASESDLFLLTKQGDSLLAGYYNGRPALLSAITLANLLFTVATLFFMVFFNVKVFWRETQYSTLAKQRLTNTIDRYQPLEASSKKQSSPFDGEQGEMEKIHNLERLLLRVLKNHESTGGSFASERRQTELLRSVFQQKLETGYLREDSDPDAPPPDMKWYALPEEKQRSHWKQCEEQARRDLDLLREAEPSSKLLPRSCSFVQVYEDLLIYRNSKLVSLGTKKRVGGDIGSGAHLRYSVKRRLLLFLMWEESFSNMDLTRMSFSGADLHNANFSGSDLTRSRFKGTNCEGADFSRARMPGLYFYDVDVQNGRRQIAISSKDVKGENSPWDPYDGKEITCFHGATFSDADLSGSSLTADGERWNRVFPFYGTGMTDEKDKELRGVSSKELYCLEDASFDHAKLYYSRFSHISFDRTGLDHALIFDSVFQWCSARYSSLSGAALGHSALFWCDFYCANGEDAVLAQAVLLRCNFREARLKGANFAGANLLECSFHGAYCQNASFRGISQEYKQLLDNQEWESAVEHVGRSSFRNKLDFQYATLSNTDFSEADLTCTDFRHVIGNECIFTSSYGNWINAEDALFQSSIFNASRFCNSAFYRTLLRNSVFICAEFRQCRFVGADFSNTLFNQGSTPCFQGGVLMDISFLNATGITPSCFQNVSLVNCDFRGTGLQQKDLTAHGLQVKNCTFDSDLKGE